MSCEDSRGSGSIRGPERIAVGYRRGPSAGTRGTRSRGRDETPSRRGRSVIVSSQTGQTYVTESAQVRRSQSPSIGLA